MKTTLVAMLVAGTAVLGGCSSTPSYYDSPTYSSSSYDNSYSTTYGTIDSITVTRGSGNSGVAGAVVGGVVGGLVGSQVGSGSGRTAATAAGAIAGAVVGKEMQENRSERDMYQISVRMDNGDYRTVVQDSVADLRVGNRVRVVDGRVYRY